MKEKTVLIGLLAVALAAGPAHAVFCHWTGGAGTSDWFNPGNWYPQIPVAGDSPRLGVNAAYNPTVWPVYNGDNSASPPSVNFIMSQAVDAEFTMAGGVFKMDGGSVLMTNAANRTATWTHNGGTFAAGTAGPRPFELGRASNATGRIYMNNGELNAANMSLGHATGGTGQIFMNGGTINAGTIYVGNASGGTGQVVMAGGNINASGMLVGYAGGSVGELTISGGTITTTGSFNTSSNTGATSTLTMTGGRINCQSAEWAHNGYSTITIRNAVFYANLYVSLNNAKNAKAYVTVGEGGMVDADWLNFAKCDIVIEAGGVMQARGQTPGQNPVSVLSNGKIDLQGGILRLYHTDPQSYYSYIDGWISAGRVYTTLPGHWVEYSYDYDTQYISIYAVPEPAGLMLMLAGAALLRRRR